MLDAQFDFNVYDDALAVLIREYEPFSRLDNAIHESMDYYGSHNLMGYISGNQDRGRFASYAGGDLLFEEDAKAAGWTRNIGVGDVSAYDITRLLFAFNMTIPGLPVIYYGDEIAMPGGNDPDCRRMMRFDDWNEHEKQVFETVQKLGALRSNSLPLIYGDFETLYLSDKQYAFCRTYFDQIVVVVMNKSESEEKIIFALPERFRDGKLRDHFGTPAENLNGNLQLTMGPRSFDIYTKGFQP
jgi:glycosidase